MPENFLIRWTPVSAPSAEGGGLESSRQVEFQLTNARNHPVYVNALLWAFEGSWRQLALLETSGQPARFGLSFRLEPYQAVLYRAGLDQALLDALRSGFPMQVFLAHLGWPQEVRPLEAHWLQGGLVDQAALDELHP